MIYSPNIVIKKEKILLGLPKSEWMPTSQTIPLDTNGHPTTLTGYIIKSKLNDGYKKWTGTFFDREDADEFLFAIFNGNINNQPNLWRLPSPQWHPDYSEGTYYEFATVTALTNTAGGLTYSIPLDWHSGNNSIEGIGGGGAGRQTSNASCGGGGGGAYSKLNNFSASPGTLISYTIGLAGQSSQASGTDTTWNTTSMVAKAGIGASGGTGGDGGQASASIGNIKFSGGTGGSLATTNRNGGGGGAAGPNGNGGNGADWNGSNTGGGGGSNGGSSGGNPNGGNNRLGTGGGSQGNDGTNGGGGGGSLIGNARAGNGSQDTLTDWLNIYGSGSGGGGRGGGNTGYPGGNAGGYGGGGGGYSNDGVSGTGSQGLIIITYEPQKVRQFNLPMLGM